MKRIFLALLSMAGIGALLALAAVFYVIHTFSQDLPDYQKLAHYEPPVSTRIHAADGQLIEEFAAQNRIFVPIEIIPKNVKDAFLSAEDRNFYHHPGVDFMGVGRAIATNLAHAGEGRRLVGGSTITQQVAKNFLLGNEVSYKRKIREAIVAFRIEKTFSKDQILELYLNEIYLGKGRYGVAAAAMGYFNKSLDELTLAEAAYLATLPKAPNNYQVETHAEIARNRRDWIIGRMQEDGYVSKAQMTEAQSAPLIMHPQKIAENIDAHYFSEEIRRELSQRYGENALYEGGLSVRSTLDPYMQEVAASSLAAGLRKYDHRHGYRGPLQHVDIAEWQKKLAEITRPQGSKDWQIAIMLSNKGKTAAIGLQNGAQGTITADTMAWAHNAPPKAGDVILVKAEKKSGTYTLQQIPKVQGGILVMDPHTGRILAMQGGYDFEMSVFNRATQAMRQPGSSFKPFVYITALNHGFTPANQVLDGPVEFSMGAGKGMWHPENYEKDYLGMLPLRRGLELSRNTMTVRLADYIGMKNVAETAKKFHIFDNLPPYLAMALGAGETTLERMATGYGIFVNGGKDITPTLVDRIQDRYGRTIYRHDMRGCNDCGDRVAWRGQTVPGVPDNRAQVTDPRTAYQIISMLEGVTQRGTAKITFKNFHDRPIAGKTGTTNDFKDAWFIGMTPDLVIASYVGFDEPKTLGHGETGAVAAGPIVKAFMRVALADVPPIPFRIPEGLSMVRVSPFTEQRTDPSDPNAIWEAFLPGTEPGEGMVTLNQQDIGTKFDDPNAPQQQAPAQDAAPDVGTGGLY